MSLVSSSKFCLFKRQISDSFSPVEGRFWFAGVHFALRNSAIELCPQKWTVGHTKTDAYRFKEQFHRFEAVMPETRYVDDVSHWFCPKTRKMDK